MDLKGLDRWIGAYVDAWRTNDPEAVGALFADDARYYTHPFREPWEGRHAIVESWAADPDPRGRGRPTIEPWQ